MNPPTDSFWTTEYRQTLRPNARGFARDIALGALARAADASGRIDRALARPRVHFIYLHYIFDDEVEPFRKLLASLLKVMTPLSYSDAVERTVSGPIDKPYLAVSFDDGFKNCLTAAEVLESFGMRACFFVCPGVISADRETMVRFAKDRLHFPPVEFMSWDDLASLRSRGHEIGNHTLDHLRLADAPDPREQIDRGLSLLRLRFGDVSHFSWPYGSFDAITPAAREAVFAAGHSTIASGTRGAHVVPAGDARELCIRRDHVLAAAPLRHTRYLLARSAERANDGDNRFVETKQK